MKIRLTHDFGSMHQAALAEILSETACLDQYLKKLRQYARSQRNPSTVAGMPDEKQLKVIGDGFEFFGEAFVKLCGAYDARIAIKDYRLINVRDNGVDARALDSKTGQDVFIQYKCFAPTEFLTGGGPAHLDSFIAEAYQMCKSENPNGQKQWPRLVVITSAAGINRYTKDIKYRGDIECYPIDALKRLTSLPTFWEDFRSAALVTALV